MLMEDKQAPDAVPHLERLYRQAPNHPAVLARLGMCRFLQGRTDEARRLMEAALPHMPDDPALLTHLARLDLQEGRGGRAELRLRAVLATDPSDAEARYLLVTALQVQGRAEESAAALAEYERFKVLVERANKLLREQADNPKAGAEAAFEIGDLLLQVGRERTALYWLDQALARNPRYRPAHQVLADYYERKGDREKAAAHRRQLADPDRAASR
jgi:predicted Zn-dependent protease